MISILWKAKRIRAATSKKAFTAKLKQNSWNDPSNASVLVPLGVLFLEVILYGLGVVAVVVRATTVRGWLWGSLRRHVWQTSGSAVLTCWNHGWGSENYTRFVRNLNKSILFYIEFTHISPFEWDGLPDCRAFHDEKCGVVEPSFISLDPFILTRLTNLFSRMFWLY